MTSEKYVNPDHKHNCIVWNCKPPNKDLQSTEKCKGLKFSPEVFSCNVNSELCILHKCTDSKGGCNCELQNTEEPNPNEDDFKYLREEIDRQGNLILSLLGQQRDLNFDIRRVAKEIGFDLDD